MTKRNEDLRQHHADLALAVRLLAHFSTDHDNGMEIAEVWWSVLGVIEAANLEHLRLLGVDVTDRAVHFQAIGGVLWHDLYGDSGDGLPVEQLPTDGTPADQATPLAPSIQVRVDPSGHVTVAIPLPTEGGE